MAESEHSQSLYFEGKITQLFRIRMRGIFEQIIDGLSAERFAEIYGGIVKERQAKTLITIWKEKMLNSALHELDEIIAEENLDEKSRELANIIENNRLDSNTPAWRPPGNPTEHMRSLDMNEKLKIKKEWEEFVIKKEASVNQLMAEVQEGRQEILELDKRLNAEIENLLKLSKAEKRSQSHIKTCLRQLSQEDLKS